jgi:hypothetical protein
MLTCYTVSPPLCTLLFADVVPQVTVRIFEDSFSNQLMEMSEHPNKLAGRLTCCICRLSRPGVAGLHQLEQQPSTGAKDEWEVRPLGRDRRRSASTAKAHRFRNHHPLPYLDKSCHTYPTVTQKIAKFGSSPSYAALFFNLPRLCSSYTVLECAVRPDEGCAS